MVPEPPRTLARTYLDTADWRAYRAGLAVEVDRDGVSQAGARATLTVRRLSTSAVVASEPIGSTPAFAPDLPMAEVWAALRVVIEDRRLLPRLEVRVRSHRLRLLNSDGKTVAAVALDRYLAGGADEPHRVVRLATVSPLRGYERDGARVGAVLEQAGFPPEDQPPLVVVRASMAMPAPGEPAGPAAPLHRSMPAAVAVAAVLGRLRDQFLANEQGARERFDAEFLHEVRVALRRARSVIRQAGELLPAEAASNLAAELRWLAGVTGPVRDLDVHLAAIRHARDDLEPLRAYLTQLHDEAQNRLVDAMDTRRYRDLLEAWRGSSQAEGPARAPGRVSTVIPDVPLAGEAVDALIRRAHRRVLKLGRTIDDSTPAAVLHDLRKRGKELRYLLECFASLYPDAARNAAVKELKALQDNLGEFQDCQVQAAALREMADHLLAARMAPASTLMAMGRLSEVLDGRQGRARGEFEARFRRFSASASRRRFSALTGPAEDPDAHRS